MFLNSHHWVLAAAVWLGGCAAGASPPAPTPAPAIEPLQQMMQQANQAAAEGSKDRARALYAGAARTYPTSKEPWLKLAQDHFESKNYGQAILAAQEVVQRDASDTVATGILAVSGLRVSAQGLNALRQQQRRLVGNTRSEAEDIVRILRDLLGEPVLVPAAPAPALSSAGAAPAPRPHLAPRAKSAPGAAAKPVASPAPTATPVKAEPPANPFNILTK